MLKAQKDNLVTETEYDDKESIKISVECFIRVYYLFINLSGCTRYVGNGIDVKPSGLSASWTK